MPKVSDTFTENTEFVEVNRLTTTPASPGSFDSRTPLPFKSLNAKPATPPVVHCGCVGNGKVGGGGSGKVGVKNGWVGVPGTTIGVTVAICEVTGTMGVTLAIGVIVALPFGGGISVPSPTIKKVQL